MVPARQAIIQDAAACVGRERPRSGWPSPAVTNTDLVTHHAKDGKGRWRRTRGPYRGRILGWCGVQAAV